MKLSPDEQKLLVAICEGMAGQIILNLPTDHESNLNTAAQYSSFKDCCAILSVLGVFERLDAYLFRPVIPQHEVRAHLSKLRSLPDPLDLKHIIGTYLYIEDSDDGVPTTRDVFAVSARHMSAMNCFVTLGFANQVDACFQWTTKATSFMEAAYIWFPDKPEDWEGTDTYSGIIP